MSEDKHFDLSMQLTAITFVVFAVHGPQYLTSARVVLKNSTAATSELASELQDFVVSRLPIFKRPRWVEFFPELPKTATGKLQRYKLRQMITD